jgi:hypothetical protein
MILIIKTRRIGWAERVTRKGREGISIGFCRENQKESKN